MFTNKSNFWKQTKKFDINCDVVEKKTVFGVIKFNICNQNEEKKIILFMEEDKDDGGSGRQCSLDFTQQK